jgi:hypothetical protein
MVKLFKKVILKMVQTHNEERGLLNASQFGFHARHSTTLQCIRLTDHVTSNFNNNMSTAEGPRKAGGSETEWLTSCYLVNDDNLFGKKKNIQ